jgi:hypothetical protein
MRDWSVTVNWDAKGDVTEQLLFDIAAIGGAAGGLPGRKRIETTMTIVAEDPMGAVRQAILKMSQVCSGEIASIEVATTEEFDRRLGEPAFPELVGIAEVARILGVSPQRASTIQHQDAFPGPVAVLASGPVWRRGDLTRFEETWVRRPGRKPAAPKPTRP